MFSRVFRWLLLCCPAFFFAVVTLHAQPENNCLAYSHERRSAALKVKAATIGLEAGHYDLAWLDPALKTNKVLLLGENHWMSSIGALEEAIIFYANTKGSFPLLVLEKPYSATGYVNAYLQAGPDAAAYLDALKPLFSTRESIAMLQHLRAWNAAHPDKPIKVVCSDVEQVMGFTLKTVIRPYFTALGDTKLLAMVKTAGTLNEAIVTYLDSVVRQSPAGFVVKDKPFLTKHYLLNVLENFQVRYQAFRNEATQDPATNQALFMAARQRQIVRNLTDDAFFGSLLTQHNSILLGGASHMKVYKPTSGPDAEEPMSGEGWYLAHDFAPTKDRTYSLKLTNLSYKVSASCIQQNAKTNLSSYDHLVALYRECPSISQRSGYRLLDDLTLLTNALLPTFRQNHDQPIRLSGKVEMTRLLKQSADLRQDANWQEFYSHDVVIMLPTATLDEVL